MVANAWIVREIEMEQIAKYVNRIIILLLLPTNSAEPLVKLVCAILLDQRTFNVLMTGNAHANQGLLAQNAINVKRIIGTLVNVGVRVVAASLREAKTMLQIVILKPGTADVNKMLRDKGATDVKLDTSTLTNKMNLDVRHVSATDTHLNVA